jgi:hypothetical protein
VLAAQQTHERDAWLSITPGHHGRCVTQHVTEAVGDAARLVNRTYNPNPLLAFSSAFHGGPSSARSLLGFSSSHQLTFTPSELWMITQHEPNVSQVKQALYPTGRIASRSPHHPVSAKYLKISNFFLCM